MEGGELFDQIQASSEAGEVITEGKAQSIITQVFLLDYVDMSMRDTFVSVEVRTDVVMVSIVRFWKD